MAGRGSHHFRAGHCVLAVLALVLAGCAGTTTSSPSATGSVHGTIIQVGGPPGAGPGHPAGAVTVSHGGHQVAEQKVAEGGEFRFTLTPGAYRLAVKDVDGGCAPTDVTVPAGTSDQAVELTCQRK